jgi:hypothetical protein
MTEIMISNWKIGNHNVAICQFAILPMLIDEQLETDLKKLLDDIQQTKVGTVERQKAFSRFLVIFWPIAEVAMKQKRAKYGFWQEEHDDEMDNILLAAMGEARDKVDQFTMAEATYAEGSIRKALINWLNKKCRLEYKIQDYRDKIVRQPKPFCLDETTKSGIVREVEDRTIDGIPRLNNLERLIEEWQTNGDRRVAQTIAEILEEDPQVEFKVPGPGAKKPCRKTSLSACHPQNSEEINCRKILQLVQTAHYFTEISAELRINYQSFVKRYQRHCKPHMQEMVANRLGYDPLQENI